MVFFVQPLAKGFLLTVLSPETLVNAGVLLGRWDYFFILLLFSNGTTTNFRFNNDF
jgi:hypothetical protein